MRIISTQTELTALLQQQYGRSVGFVPTMGALHEGHLSLVRRSVEENDVTAVSIFVNPTQFDDPADLRRYPRTEEKDAAMLDRSGCDILFMPSVEEMYPAGKKEEAAFSFGRLETILEGAHRRGHFRGVAQIVHRLLTLVQPARFYLGQKDYQQYLVIRELVRQAGMQAEVILCPAVREPDGLAMSSRNVNLPPQEREEAAGIYRALLGIKEKAGTVSPEELICGAAQSLEDIPSLEKVDYLEIADAETLLPVRDWNHPGRLIALAAVRMRSGVRLIDNLFVRE